LPEPWLDSFEEGVACGLEYGDLVSVVERGVEAGSRGIGE